MNKEIIKVGDRVRICQTWVRDKSRFIYGIVESVDSEDISYHGSPCYETTYFVRLDSGSSERVKYLETVTRSHCHSYISPIPSREIVCSRILEKISELNGEIAKNNMAAVAELVKGTEKPYVEYPIEKANMAQEEIIKLISIGEKMATGEIPLEDFEWNGDYELRLN